MAIRVVLADDHRMFREGLRRVLEESGQVEVVGEAANGLEAIERAAELRPDVVIMDVGMAIMNGVEATSQIARKKFARVVVLSIYEDESTIGQALRAGALGYVVKSSAGRELIDCLHVVLKGEVFLSPSLPPALRDAVANHPRGPKAGAGPLAALTRRQRQVLQLLAEGHTNKEIADLLGLSPETVKSHRKTLMSALGVRGVAHLTQLALAHGLVRRPQRPPPPPAS
jgi:DNA-binding NarL/FixJ family response regulator